MGGIGNAIGGLFNAASGNVNYTPEKAVIDKAATPEQAAQQYANMQQNIGQQNDLYATLAAQNGIGNQSLAFQNAQNLANGVGANPAQAQLAQATQANTANQAALMAGQRGTGANAGLLARQAAMQGAANQQNAAGQAATMQAQQSLQGQQLMAQIAAQQVAQQQGQLQQAGGMAQNAYGQTSNAVMGQNNANINQTNANNALQADIKQKNAAGQAKLIGGLVNAGAQAATMGGSGAAAMAEGGMVPYKSKHAGYMKSGGQVPGEAEVDGDSYENDTVKALLSPGEIVIPRSVVNSADPAEAAKRFVAAIMARKGAK